MQSRETNEEFAREQENANKGWETCYGAALKARLKWIDQMLMEGTDEAHEKLLAFFADEKEIAPYGNRSNAMIEMIVIMDIYKAEVEMGEEMCIRDRQSGDSFQLFPNTSSRIPLFKIVSTTLAR